MRLDRTDLEIVRELQADGRLPFEGLAGKVGLSRAAARLRVRRLVDTGAIRLVGVVHPRVRGMSAHAHLSIDVLADAAPVAAAVAALPEATLVSMVAGRFPLVAELRGADLRAIGATVDRVRALPGVRDIDTVVYTDVVKDPYLSARTPPEIELDELDQRVLCLLERDGRSSFADLAAEVGLSAGAARSRVLRLVDSSAVRVTALVDSAALGFGRLGGFTLRLDRPDTGAVAEAASWDRVQFLARCVGRADLVGTVTAGSVEDLNTVYEDMRALAGIRVTETWVHMNAVKERRDGVNASIR